MRRIALFAGLVGLALLSAPLNAQTVKRVVVWQSTPISQEDSSNHVDLRVGYTAPTLSVAAYDSTGRAIAGLPVRWSTTNSKIAKVSSGKVTGVARGYATISATVGGVRGMIHACVASTARYELNPVADSSRVVLARGWVGPDLPDTTQVGMVVYMHGADTTGYSSHWPTECVHWYIGAPTGQPISPDQRVLHGGIFLIRKPEPGATVTHFFPGAAIGTTYPVWIPRSNAAVHRSGT